MASLLTNFTYGWRRGRGDTGIPCAPGLFYGLVGVLGLFLAAAEDALSHVDNRGPGRAMHGCERLALAVVTACKLYFDHNLTLGLDQYEDSEEVQEGAGNEEKSRQTQAVRHPRKRPVVAAYRPPVAIFECFFRGGSAFWC